MILLHTCNFQLVRLSHLYVIISLCHMHRHTKKHSKLITTATSDYFLLVDATRTQSKSTFSGLFQDLNSLSLPRTSAASPEVKAKSNQTIQGPSYYNTVSWLWVELRGSGF